MVDKRSYATFDDSVLTDLLRISIVAQNRFTKFYGSYGSAFGSSFISSLPYHRTHTHPSSPSTRKKKDKRRNTVITTRANVWESLRLPIHGDPVASHRIASHRSALHFTKIEQREKGRSLAKGYLSFFVYARCCYAVTTTTIVPSRTRVSFVLFVLRGACDSRVYRDTRSGPFRADHLKIGEQQDEQ